MNFAVNQEKHVVLKKLVESNSMTEKKKKEVVGNCIADQVFMYGLCKVLKVSVENYQSFPTMLSDSHFVSDRTLFKHYLNIF